MAIAILAERNSLADKYAADSPYGALFTADPGTSGSATGEVTGGSPAYARKALSWGSSSASVVTSSATTFDIPASTTLTFFAVATSNVAGAATLRDKISITSQNFASQGTYTVTATYTQS